MIFQPCDTAGFLLHEHTMNMPAKKILNFTIFIPVGFIFVLCKYKAEKRAGTIHCPVMPVIATFFLSFATFVYLYIDIFASGKSDLKTRPDETYFFTVNIRMYIHFDGNANRPACRLFFLTRKQ
jgi:hypothetical protein